MTTPDIRGTTLGMRRSPEEAPTRVGAAPPPNTDDLALYVLSGPARGRYFKVPRRGGVIGRDAEVPLRIDDPGISRGHCRLFRNDRGFFCVEDLDSRYGTFVEGQSTTHQVVMDGDRLQLSAETVVRVRYQDVREPERLDRPASERIRDPLTRLYDRRVLLERLEQEYAFARRHQLPLSVLMLDLDHFTRVNQDFGHGVGDRVLRGVARRLSAAVRTEDLLTRIGSDEFVVLARGDAGAAAEAFADRLLQLLRAQPISARGTAVALTASVGISTFEKNQATSMMELLVEADAALYEAKRLGRDRVAAWSAS